MLRTGRLRPGCVTLFSLCNASRTRGICPWTLGGNTKAGSHVPLPNVSKGVRCRAANRLVGIGDPAEGLRACFPIFGGVALSPAPGEAPGELDDLPARREAEEARMMPGTPVGVELLPFTARSLSCLSISRWSQTRQSTVSHGTFFRRKHASIRERLVARTEATFGSRQGVHKRGYVRKWRGLTSYLHNRCRFIRRVSETASRHFWTSLVVFDTEIVPNTRKSESTTSSL